MDPSSDRICLEMERRWYSTPSPSPSPSKISMGDSEKNSGCGEKDFRKIDLSNKAPLIVFLGPCFSSKNVLFGAPMEHINFRDCAEFYELVPLETAVEVWNSTAHEGTLKALKHKLVGGKSVLERLRSPQCYEQALLSLYFDQLITKKELKERIELHFQDNKRLMDSFLGAIWGVKAGKSGSIQMANTVQMFIPEAHTKINGIMSKRIKWAIKYNPEIISLDEGNLLSNGYNISPAISYACKYGRQVRIARWGQEISDVSLSDLIREGLLCFLQTGRYVDCATIAASYEYAERRRVNAVGGVTSQEDFVFDAGFTLDKDGFVSKFHHPHYPAAPDVRKFSLFGLFPRRSDKGRAQDAGKSMSTGGSSKRRSTLFSSFSLLTSSSDKLQGLQEINPEHEIIEKQIQRELGISSPHALVTTASASAATAAGQERNPNTSSTSSKRSPDMEKLSAVAARNAQVRRLETDWVEFVNHKSVTSNTLITVSSPSQQASASSSLRGSLRRDSFASTVSKQSKIAHSSALPRPDKLHDSSNNSLLSVVIQEGAQNSNIRVPDLSVELGSYSYGLKINSSERSLSSNDGETVPQGKNAGASTAAKRAFSNEYENLRDREGTVCADFVPQAPPPPQHSEKIGPSVTVRDKNNQLLRARPQQSSSSQKRVLLTMLVPRGKAAEEGKSRAGSVCSRSGGSTAGVDPLATAYGSDKAAKAKKEMMILTTAVAATSNTSISLSSSLSSSFSPPPPVAAPHNLSSASNVTWIPHMELHPTATAESQGRECEAAVEKVVTAPLPPDEESMVVPAAEAAPCFGILSEVDAAPLTCSELSPPLTLGEATTVPVPAVGAKGVGIVDIDECDQVLSTDSVEKALLPAPSKSTPTGAAVGRSVRFQVPIPVPIPSPMIVPKLSVYVPTASEVAKLKAFEQRQRAAEIQLKAKEDAVNALKTSHKVSEELKKQEFSAEMASVKAKALAIENRVRSRKDLLQKDSIHNLSAKT